MKRISSIVMALFYLNIAISQSTDGIINNCARLLESNNLTVFESDYQKIFPEYLKENIGFYENALMEIKNNNSAGVYPHLDSMIQAGYLLDEIKVDKNFESLHEDNKWASFVNKLDSSTSKFDNSLRVRLKKIQYKDQGIRVMLLAIRDSLGASSPLALRVADEMKKIDRLNATEIQEIVDDNGWLGADVIGNEGNQTLFLGIQHVNDLVVQQKYLPLIKQAVDKGKADAWEFAFLTDRILMNQGKEQIYGSQVITSDTSAGPFIVPLQHPDEVDQLRNDVGLGNLKTYLQDFDLEWDLAAYKRDLPKIKIQYRNWFTQRQPQLQ